MEFDKVSSIGLVLILAFSAFGASGLPASNMEDDPEAQASKAVCGSASLPATDGCTRWASREAAGKHDLATDVAASPDGKYVASVGYGDMRMYSGCASDLVGPNCEGPTPSVLFAPNNPLVGEDITPTSKIAVHDGSTGEIVWRSGFPFSPASLAYVWSAAAFDASGQHLIVVGATAAASFAADTGGLEWYSPLPGWAQDLQIGPSGEHVYVAGVRDFSTDDAKLSLLSLSADDGQLEWQTTYAGESSGDQTNWLKPISLALAPDGDHLYVADTELDLSELDEDARIAAYTSEGQLVWEHVVDETEDDTVHDLAVAEDGSSLVAAGISGDGLALALDPSTGSIQWSQELADWTAPGVTLGEEGQAAAFLPAEMGPAVEVSDGRVYLAGSETALQPQETPPEYVRPLQIARDLSSPTLAALELSDGSLSWAVQPAIEQAAGQQAPSLASSGYEDYFADLRVVGDTVVATGTARGDYFTASVDIGSGSTLWQAYQEGAPAPGATAGLETGTSDPVTGPADLDLATSLAVPSDASSVFVSGASKGIGPTDHGTGYDFYSLAYPLEGPTLDPHLTS